MSAPSTNIERQKKRHRGPLLWMAVSVGIVALLFAGFYIVATDAEEGEVPAAAATTETDG